MAQLLSMKLLKLPKAPALDASKPVWDKYEKRKREVLAHNKKVKSELERRKKEKLKR